MDGHRSKTLTQSKRSFKSKSAEVYSSLGPSTFVVLQFDTWPSTLHLTQLVYYLEIDRESLNPVC